MCGQKHYSPEATDLVKELLPAWRQGQRKQWWCEHRSTSTAGEASVHIHAPHDTVCVHCSDTGGGSGTVLAQTSLLPLHHPARKCSNLTFTAWFTVTSHSQVLGPPTEAVQTTEWIRRLSPPAKPVKLVLYPATGETQRSSANYTGHSQHWYMKRCCH